MNRDRTQPMAEEASAKADKTVAESSKKKSLASAAFDRLTKREETLRKQRQALETKVRNHKLQLKRAQHVEFYMEEENRTKNDEYRSLTDELKHRDQACKSFHSQIARLDRQVAVLHHEMGVGHHHDMVDLLPDAVSMALDQALQQVDEEEQSVFTQLHSTEERLRVIKGNQNAVDRPRVTIVIKNVDPSARNRSANALQRTFIATEGLTFQDILEDSLRFWNMLPEDLKDVEETKGEETKGSTTDTTDTTSREHSSSGGEEKQTNKFCLSDEGGALRLPHMLISKDIKKSDATKDDLVLSYLLFSLPKLDLAKVKEFSVDLDTGGFEHNASDNDDDASASGDSDDSVDDGIHEHEDDENHVDLFRYDSVLSNTPLLVKDLVFYLCWLTVWISLSLVRRNISFDNQVSTLSKHWLSMRHWDGDTQDRWVDFESITTTDEWWSWIQGPVTLTMTKAHGMHKAIDFGGSEQGAEGGNAGGAFVLHGGWRLRQARVPPNCLDFLSSTIRGKSIKSDPTKKLLNYYGTYDRLFCYSELPFGPLSNGADTNTLAITHFAEKIDPSSGKPPVFSTTITEHTITKMTETPDSSTIALKYTSFNPFEKTIAPIVDDPDTIAWLKAFLFYPAPTAAQTFDNQNMKPYKDYRNPDYFDTAPKHGQISDYGGSGYVLELSANLTSASVAYRINKLKENNWIDGQTRAVIARANFFNVNTGHWAVIDALTEWDQSGKIKTMFRATPIVTDHYYTALGKLGGIFSVVVFLGALYFLYQQISYWRVVRQSLYSDTRIETIRYLKRATCPVTISWFSSMWTLIELGVLVPCLIARTLDIILLVDPKRNFQVQWWPPMCLFFVFFLVHFTHSVCFFLLLSFYPVLHHQAKHQLLSKFNSINIDVRRKI